MKLSPRDIDKLTIFMVANSARQRRECGVKLNYIEACALISESILAGAREDVAWPSAWRSASRLSAPRT